MQYLIIREIEYQNLDNSFDVMNQTTDINKANDMLQGYTLINKDKDTTYSIVKYETPFSLNARGSIMTKIRMNTELRNKLFNKIKDVF